MQIRGEKTSTSHEASVLLVCVGTASLNWTCAGKQLQLILQTLHSRARLPVCKAQRNLVEQELTVSRTLIIPAHGQGFKAQTWDLRLDWGWGGGEKWKAPSCKSLFFRLKHRREKVFGCGGVFARSFRVSLVQMSELEDYRGFRATC